MSRDSPKSVRIKFQEISDEHLQQPVQNYNPSTNHDYHNNKPQPDYGNALDSDITRLRMEVNLQHRSLIEQINASKFKARQAAQERDLAKNDLERLISSVNNKTNRFYQHEKPLQSLQDNNIKNKLRTQRSYNGGSSHSRRNLDAYSKIYFNNFSNQRETELIHNDHDPFNINISSQIQPKIDYGNKQGVLSGDYGTILTTNSHTVAFENNTQNFIRPKGDPLLYGTKQFEHESTHAMNQIGISVLYTV